jgi:DNA primase
MIPDDVIAEIRSRVDIVAVIGEHVQLKRSGSNWRGLCPFHSEKTGSFYVYPAKGFFICYGCQKKGDAFTFAMEFGGRSFVEAAEQLAARAGVALQQVEESPEVKRARGERAAMLDINKKAAAFFRQLLADPVRGAPGRAYLDKRGCDQAMRDRFQLGYAPGDWRALADHLKAARVDMELAVKLGLVAPQPKMGGYYDRFRDRLVCPVIVPGGDVVGFSARIIEGAAKPEPDRDPPPKYINSPESAVYKKSKLLFGLAQAREAMGTRKRAVLVEGNFDVISMHQAGFTEVVAPLGTAITADQIDLLRRLTERVVLLYDGDRAGYAATLHALELCAAADVEVLVASRPGTAKSGGAGPLADGQDPDSLLATGGADAVRQLLDNARGGFEYFAYEVWAKAKGSADAMSRALDHAVTVVAKVANETKRDLILGKLALALDVDLGVVRRALARAQSAPRGSEARGPAPAAATPPVRPPPTEEVELIALCADHPDLLSTAEADRAFSLLTDARLRAICSAARAGQSLVELATAPTSGLPETATSLVLSGKYAADTDPSARLAAMAQNLRHRKVSSGPGRKGEAMADLQARLVEAQRKGDRELARQLASEIVTTRKQVD